MEKISVLARTVAVAAALLVGQRGFAQSNVDGAIAGKVANAKATITVESSTTGLKRSVTPAADGSFRVGSLPPGLYQVLYTPPGGAPITEDVTVTLGGTAQATLDQETLQLEKLTVTGTSINPIDFGKTTPSIVLSKSNIDTLPIARNFSAVALLTPGTVQADSQFNLIGVGRVATFGGSSAAENAYYVNGYNLTNFRNGLGGSNVPWEFYDQFEIIDGWYPAQYGRATGGVINSTTKRGTNDYHAEANFLYRPSGWRNPSVYFTDSATGQRQIRDYRSLDTTESKQGNLIVSGPLWKDKLFFAGLVSQINTDSVSVADSGTTYRTSAVHNPFYALKIDAEPIQEQHFEYTFFTDKEETNRKNYTFDAPTKTIGATPYSTPNYSRGGKNNIFSYTGVFLENFTVHALYGKGRFDWTNSSPQDPLPYVQDARGSLAAVPKTLQGVSSRISAYDERKAKRADIEYAFDLWGSHRLRVGYDAESNLSVDQTEYGGGERWRYVSATPGKTVLGVVVPDGVTELIFKRVFKTGGSFKVDSDAYYVEDHWSALDDRLVLDLGFRMETFQNFNAEGKSFIEVKNQKSPRLGVAYDLFGDKKTKVFANWGRFFLPVATNTNIRLAGAQLDDQYYYLPGTGTQSNGAPAIGNAFAHSLVSPGVVPDTTSVVDKNIKPMYQDVFIVGVQRELSRQWNASFRATYRNLGSSFDDAIVDQALNKYAAANNLPDQTDSFQYVLINPGSPATINWDFGDGVKREVNMSAADLGYPKAERKDYSAEFSLERVWDGKFWARFSYVWAHNFGNTEGLVLSDNGQTDAGITQQFDTPDLVKNTYGNLPNDRRHTFKFFGAWGITPELQASIFAQVYSGKPINRIGALEDANGNVIADSIADFYGAAYLLKPRGSVGRTPWIFNADAKIAYEPKWARMGRVQPTFEFEIYNLLNRHGVTAVDEYATSDEGNPQDSYLAATDFQPARYFQFLVRLKY